MTPASETLPGGEGVNTCLGVCVLSYVPKTPSFFFFFSWKSLGTTELQHEGGAEGDVCSRLTENFWPASGVRPLLLHRISQDFKQKLSRTLVGMGDTVGN